MALSHHKFGRATNSSVTLECLRFCIITPSCPSSGTVTVTLKIKNCSFWFYLLACRLPRWLSEKHAGISQIPVGGQNNDFLMIFSTLSFLWTVLLKPFIGKFGQQWIGRKNDICLKLEKDLIAIDFKDAMENFLGWYIRYVPCLSFYCSGLITQWRLFIQFNKTNYFECLLCKGHSLGDSCRGVAAPWGQVCVLLSTSKHLVSAWHVVGTQ